MNDNSEEEWVSYKKLVIATLDRLEIMSDKLIFQINLMGNKVNLNEEKLKEIKTEINDIKNDLIRMEQDFSLVKEKSTKSNTQIFIIGAILVFFASALTPQIITMIFN